MRFNLKEEGIACLSAKVAMEAISAEAGLGLSPDSTNPIGDWLVMLTKEIPSTVLYRTDNPANKGIERHWTARCIENPCRASDMLCSMLQMQEMKAEQDQRLAAYSPTAQPPTSDWQVETEVAGEEQRRLRDAYLRQFPNNAILDICWAGNQHYREWTKWTGGKCKSGSKPDRCFRSVLTSGKSPSEYRPEPRPKGWK